jgi:hypothetical protein
MSSGNNMLSDNMLSDEILLADNIMLSNSTLLFDNKKLSFANKVPTKCNLTVFFKIFKFFLISVHISPFNLHPNVTQN